MKRDGNDSNVVFQLVQHVFFSVNDQQLVHVLAVHVFRVHNYARYLIFDEAIMD